MLQPYKKKVKPSDESAFVRLIKLSANVLFTNVSPPFCLQKNKALNNEWKCFKWLQKGRC